MTIVKRTPTFSTPAIPTPTLDPSTVNLAEYFTVEEASRFLTCQQPVPLPVLQQLGKDASLYCRIKQIACYDKPVFGKRWPTERAYTKAVILEVFHLNPTVRDFVPKA